MELRTTFSIAFKATFAYAMLSLPTNLIASECVNSLEHTNELKLNMDFFLEQAIEAEKNDKDNQAFDAYYISRYVYVNAYEHSSMCTNGKYPIRNEKEYYHDSVIWYTYKLGEATNKKNMEKIIYFSKELTKSRKYYSKLIS